MPLYVLTHKWRKENLKTVTKKVIEAMAQIPEGASMSSSYIKADLTGAWCIWNAKSDKQIVDFLTKMVPEMETEASQTLQFFPPESDVYSIMHTLIS